MKLLSAIFGLGYIFVDLATASPNHTGLTGYQGNGKLLTKRSTQDWVDMSTPQNLCIVLSPISTQAGGVVSDSGWAGFLEDCQSLGSQADSQNGYADINLDLSGSSVIVLSHGSCTLSVELCEGLPGFIPGTIHVGKSDISKIVNLLLGYMLNVTTPDEQFSSLAGRLACDTLDFPSTMWNLTLQNSPSTDHKASLVKRASQMIWVATSDTPEDTCSDSKDVTMLFGHPGVNFTDIMHDCQTLQATYNSSNEGYWNVSLSDDSINHFTVLDSQGVCSLLFIVLGRTELPVTFQVGNTDITDIIGNSTQLLYNEGTNSDTVAVTGRMGCDTDDSVQVMWAVAFDGLASEDVDMEGLREDLERRRSTYAQ